MRCLRKFLGLLALSGLLVGPLSATPAAPADRAIGRAAAPAPVPPHPVAAPSPAIWLLADDDTRIYLFGTVHILPPELKWRSAAFDRIADEADELVLEVAADVEDPSAIASLIMLGKEVPILSRVSSDRRKTLQEIIQSLGVPVQSLDGMQTWAAAMTITVAALAQAYAGEDEMPPQLTGVEDALREDFTRTGRPISGVETGPQQLGFLSRLSYRTQRDMLEMLVDSYELGDSAPTEVGEAAWLGGDVERIGAEMSQMPPELFDVLITRRNTRWTAWLIDRLERPGTVLFAVGAGHLAGRDSVQSMLEAHGHRVARLD